MEIFLAQPQDALRDRFFPKQLLDRLASIAALRVNDTGRVLNGDDLARGVGGADIVIIISWAGGQLLTEDVLAGCPNLKLIAIPCGSVATTATDAVYHRGVAVASANAVMARYVAEGALAYMLHALRDITALDGGVRRGEWRHGEVGSLIGASVGLVGLGTVGRNLLDLLRPFGVTARVYDPYVNDEALTDWPFARLSTLEDTLSLSRVISVHASKTPRTYHMLDRDRLRLIPDGALFINTARGAVIDEAALARELADPTRRLRAVLDVFETEPLPPDSPLPRLDNVTLQPHTAGAVSVEHFSRAMVEEIERFVNGKPLEYVIPYEQYSRMTR
ncbi:MAG: hydroxyacid dehydrogenase [Oscillospiraceae bacterium]|nr:hydroxyacid dehydrogenase [Oscillospiraceae bacterium]